jgi:hypothetical protein
MGSSASRISEICKLANVVQSSELAPTQNSTSPTIVGRLFFKENISFEGHSVSVGFCKLAMAIDEESLIYNVKEYEQLLHLKPYTHWSTVSRLILFENECQIYSKIINPIMSQRYSINFVRPLGYGIRCSSIYARELLDTSLMDPIIEIENNDRVFYNIIVTEFTTKLTYYNWLRTKNVSGEEILGVVFQIATACAVLESQGVHHGDLHGNNVLIEELKDIIVIRYTIDKVVYTLRTRWIAKVYDFDLASAKSLEIKRSVNVNDMYSILKLTSEKDIFLADVLLPIIAQINFNPALEVKSKFRTTIVLLMLKRILPSLENHSDKVTILLNDPFDLQINITNAESKRSRALQKLFEVINARKRNEAREEVLMRKRQRVSNTESVDTGASTLGVEEALHMSKKPKK